MGKIISFGSKFEEKNGKALEMKRKQKQKQKASSKIK